MPEKWRQGVSEYQGASLLRIGIGYWILNVECWMLNINRLLCLLWPLPPIRPRASSWMPFSWVDSAFLLTLFPLKCTRDWQKNKFSISPTFLLLLFSQHQSFIKFYFKVTQLFYSETRWTAVEMFLFLIITSIHRLHQSFYRHKTTPSPASF